MAPKWMCCYFQADCGVEVVEKRNAVFRTECKIMGEVRVKFKSNQSETKNKDDVYTLDVFSSFYQVWPWPGLTTL